MKALVLIIIGSILIPGIIGRARSIFSGRKGPGLFQPLYNVALLFKKGSVIGSDSGIVQQLGPVIILSSIITAALFVPFTGQSGLLSFHYDFVIFAYLLALSRFWIIISALDAGSSFEGMGASREAFYGLLLEPAFFLFLGSFALITGNNSFESILSTATGAGFSYYLAAMLGIYVLFNSMLIENSRMPFDDPKTHLELTMIHEVMVLDLSGVDLAFIQLANFLKFGIFSALITSCLIPSNLPVYITFPAGIIIQFIIGITTGFIESFQARNRLNKNPQFILALTAITLVIIMLAILLKH